MSNQWKTCKKHGDENPNVWGCPECLRELREENARFQTKLDAKDEQIALHTKEVARLTDHLLKANAQAEEFERMYYLEQQEKEAQAAELAALCASLEEAVNLRAALWRNGGDEDYSHLTDRQLAEKDPFAKHWVKLLIDADGKPTPLFTGE